MPSSTVAGRLARLLGGADSRSTLRRLVPGPLRRTLWWSTGRLEAMQQTAFERRLGVRTTGHVYLYDAESETVGDNVFYEGCQWLPLRRTLRDLGAGAGDVFVDLGSGKGQALLIAGLLPVDRVVGIDLVDDLTQVARRNLAAARRRLHCRSAEAVTADVLAWPVPDDVSIVFLYCPFFGEVFDTAVRRLLDSYDRRPRPLRIVYAFPWEHNRLLSTGRVAVEAVHPAQWPARPWWWRTGWTIVTYRVVDAGTVPAPPPHLPRRLFRPPRAVERWSVPNDQRFRLYRPGHGYIKVSDGGGP